MLPAAGSIAMRIAQVLIVNALGLVAGSIWIRIERRMDDPIMRKRINSGSDRFFEQEAERERKVVLSNSLDLDDF
jgi:hypothetical protein